MLFANSFEIISPVLKFRVLQYTRKFILSTFFATDTHIVIKYINREYFNEDIFNGMKALNTVIIIEQFQVIVDEFAGLFDVDVIIGTDIPLMCKHTLVFHSGNTELGNRDIEL